MNRSCPREEIVFWHMLAVCTLPSIPSHHASYTCWLPLQCKQQRRMHAFFSRSLSPRGLDRSSVRKGMFTVPGKILERLNNTRRKQVQFFDPLSLVCFILKPWGLGELEKILTCTRFNPSQPLTIPFGFGVKRTGSKVE